VDTRQHTQAGPTYQYRTGWEIEKNNAECFGSDTRHTFTLSSAKSQALAKSPLVFTRSGRTLTHTQSHTHPHTHALGRRSATHHPAPPDRPRSPGRHPPPPDGRPPLPDPRLPGALARLPAPWRDAPPAAARRPGHPAPLPPSVRRRVVPLPASAPASLLFLVWSALFA